MQNYFKMKKISRILLLINLTGLLLFMGCTQEEIVPLETGKSINDKQALVREVSLLLGNVLTNSEVKEVVLTGMREVDKYGELVSFAYLLGDKNNLKKNEKTVRLKNAGTNFTSTIFRDALVNEFQLNRENYQILSREIKQAAKAKGRLKTTPSNVYDMLTDLLVNERLEIFFPYENALNVQQLETFYVSYNPMDGSQTNEVFQFAQGREGYITIDEVHNDFIDVNPVFGVVPICPCDIPGEPCNFIELVPYKYYQGSIGQQPPVFGNTPILLTHNVRHRDVTDDRFILTTRIPLIKATSNAWTCFFGTRLHLALVRAAGEGTIRVNADGSITADGIPHTVGSISIRRRYGRDGGTWLVFPGNYDPHWRMSEYSHSIGAFSHHDLAVTASATLGFKSGFKIGPEGTPIPHFEASGSGTINVERGGARFRAGTEISREQALATVVGANTTTYVTFGGVNYNVKEIDIIRFIFQHWTTSLK